MDKEEFEKKKQEIIAPIMVSKDEVLNIREKQVGDREKRCKDLEIINKQLKEVTNEADVQISNMFREFESKNIPSSEIKIYLTKLWEFMCIESLRRFSSSYEKYRELEDKSTKEKDRYWKKIREYEGKIRNLNDTKSAKSVPKGCGEIIEQDKSINVVYKCGDKAFDDSHFLCKKCQESAESVKEKKQ